MTCPPRPQSWPRRRTGTGGSSILRDDRCDGCRQRGAPMKLTDFTTLTFDMMGTLMDYEAGFIAWFRTHAAADRPDVADTQILEALARAEEVLQRDKPHPPFTHMLPLMYLAVASEFSLRQDKQLAESFGASVAEWPPFADSVESLR